LLERIIRDIAHPGGKGKLGDDILGLPEEVLDKRLLLCKSLA
jgi:hypothetical protein